MLDQLPAELNEQAYMWQWEQGVDGDSNWRQEWPGSGRKPGAGEEQLGTVDWVCESWEQKGAEEGFAEGTERQSSSYCLMSAGFPNVSWPMVGHAFAMNYTIAKLNKEAICSYELTPVT